MGGTFSDDIGSQIPSTVRIDWSRFFGWAGLLMESLAPGIGARPNDLTISILRLRAPNRRAWYLTTQDLALAYPA